MQLSDRIGRRMKLHDLHVLMSVVQSGSMGKAAALLNTTQSAVSRSISELEHAIGARLLDRSRHGVEPTESGRALLDGGAAVFDNLRQTVKNIEFLADPTVGHITVGGTEATSAGLLPAMFGRLRRQHPGLSMHVVPVLSVAEQNRELRDRKVDLIVGRIPPTVEPDIEAEVLFHDHMYVVAGRKNPWTRRRNITLAELAGEPWVLPPADTLVGSLIADMFRACNVDFPPKGAATGSIHLFCALLASGPFLAMFPGAVLRLATHLPAGARIVGDAAEPAVAGRDHDLETSDAQSGDKALHRERPHGRENGREAGAAVRSCESAKQASPSLRRSNITASAKFDGEFGT